MVIRGSAEHPGANAVEDENGRVVNLSHMQRNVRTLLLAEPPLSKPSKLLYSSAKLT